MLQKNTNMNINDIEIDSTLENNGKQTGFFCSRRRDFIATAPSQRARIKRIQSTKQHCTMSIIKPCLKILEQNMSIKSENLLQFDAISNARDVLKKAL